MLFFKKIIYVFISLIITAFFLFLLLSLKLNHSKSKCSFDTILYDKHIYADFKLNDNVNSKLIIDTGAKGLYLDSVFCNNEFKNAPKSSYKINGGGNEVKTIKMLKNDIVVNYDKFFKSFNKIPVINFKNIVGKKVDGVIGNDFFIDKILFIDYVKNYINITNNLEDEKTKDYFAIPFQITNRGILANFEIVMKNLKTLNGKFLIDTGSPQFIILTKKVTLENNIDKIKNKKYYFSKNYGVGGFSEGYTFLLEHIDFFNVKIKNTVINYSLDEHGSLSSDEYIGIVGNRFLENFNVIFDYKAKILYLKPISIQLKDSYLNNHLGFSVISDQKSFGYFKISVLFEDGRDNGLMLEDILLEVNNKKVNDDMSKSDLYKLFIHGENNLKVLRNGQPINFIYNLKRNSFTPI